MITSVIKFPNQLVARGNELKFILSLRDCFEQYVLPDMEDSPEGTLSIYLTALNHWEARTRNPPVGEITNEVLREFKQSFLKENYSPETVKKYWRHIRRILRRVGPPIQGNPLGESIIERVPYMAPPKKRFRKLPRIVTDEEINAVYAACDVAKWPYTSACPTLLWRLAVVVFYNCGPRTQDFFRLRWEDVDLELKRVSFLAQKTSKLQGIPFQDIVAMHFESVFQEDSEFVFSITKCKRSLYRQWKAIQDAAGIKEHIDFRDLRETCNSNLNAANPGANTGKWVLGHGPRGVNETYYHNPTPEVIQAVENLEQPDSFYSILE
ncbi:tyrosine-type recombinase/integrase [Gimesia fumaroli]|uniref:Phage integrase family protein n=1 Tax=Gimesia fumaroli TaxID=2527976 RepID=A0A518ICJ6_9PLAN|nr:tyrosine-type recombinase/integrase [Gimesia fumaroli]QDV50814.1 Phage integrase family protein [Gimesia fumaroli]